MNILVTGGAGYIGSVAVEECLKAGHLVTVYDNLVKGHRDCVAEEAEFVEGSLADRHLLENTLRTSGAEAVIHMAAYSLVGESVKDPAKYYRNNVADGLTLLDSMRAAGVNKIVFSSTAAVYGEPERQPIEEDNRLLPTNPYGESKLAFEQALRWYENAYGIRYASLRYFNAAGASDKFGERHDPETHLIPLVLAAAAGKLDAIDIFGDDYPTRDGTCVRDYVHVIDLARAHILALGNLGERSSIYNLGCGGIGYTVREVVDTASDVTGCEIRTRIAPRRAGDPAVLIAGSDRIKAELGWRPEMQNLRTIISSAWEWMRKHAQSERTASGDPQ